MFCMTININSSAIAIVPPPVRRLERDVQSRVKWYAANEPPYEIIYRLGWRRLATTL